jgi:signal transduction histidine kinase
MSRLYALGAHFYTNWLAGRSDEDIQRRREFMLNALLCGSIVIVGFTLLYGFISRAPADILQTVAPPELLILTVILAGLWYLSRTGQHVLAAYFFLLGVGSQALTYIFSWSYESPATVLSFALLIVLCGLILGTRASLRATILIVMSFIGLSLLEIHGAFHPYLLWLDIPLKVPHAINESLFLVIIGLVSWLSNLEIDYLLRKAREAQLALVTERDNLEQKVAERTKDLEKLQLIRLLELQRLAEFGRLSASLLHEVTNPLTAASLHLANAEAKHAASLNPARRSLKQLERYVIAARKQLQGESKKVSFSLRKEVQALLPVLRPAARSADVTLTLAITDSIRLYGDPVKFSHVIANLVSNAIDAYQITGESLNQRKIVINGYLRRDSAIITVRDYALGIEADLLPHIFEAFVSTKVSSGRGLGIGLSLVKRTVEEDFYGSLRATSKPGHGTTFTIALPIKPSRRFLSGARSPDRVTASKEILVPTS